MFIEILLVIFSPIFAVFGYFTYKIYKVKTLNALGTKMSKPESIY